MSDMIKMIEGYRLCYELVDIIHSFLPREVLIWTNRENYRRYHHMLQDILKHKGMYDNYIRKIIRDDSVFIFNLIMETHTIVGWKKRKYVYRDTKYTNYFHFLDCYMFDNNATRCRDVLFTNVYKKKYKKICRSIAWTN